MGRPKECEWYWKNNPGELGFCCKDMDAGRVWDCTAPNLKERSKQMEPHEPWYSCPYPKLGKDK